MCEIFFTFYSYHSNRGKIVASCNSEPIIFLAQVTAVSNVEAKKRFEFLEAVSGTMDAHLRYFKQVNLMLKTY